MVVADLHSSDEPFGSRKTLVLLPPGLMTIRTHERFITLRSNRNIIQGGTLPWPTQENFLWTRSRHHIRNRKRYRLLHGG